MTVSMFQFQDLVRILLVIIMSGTLEAATQAKADSLSRVRLWRTTGAVGGLLHVAKEGEGFFIMRETWEAVEHCQGRILGPE